MLVAEKYIAVSPSLVIWALHRSGKQEWPKFCDIDTGLSWTVKKKVSIKPCPMGVYIVSVYTFH